MHKPGNNGLVSVTSEKKPAELYRERLLPTPWLYLVLLLLVPAIILLLMPINITLALVLAPASYLFAVLLLISASPKITVTADTFYAGQANIPVSYLGEITELDSDELSVAIGIKADARAFLLVRGWIHSALRITNTDPTDRAPYWIVTTRRPSQLAAALKSAKQISERVR